jgi:hypothetical protein
VQVLLEHMGITLLILVIFVVRHQLRPEGVIAYDAGQRILQQHQVSNGTFDRIARSVEETILLDGQGIHLKNDFIIHNSENN